VSLYFSTEPRRPSHLSDYAEVCLQALADQGLGSTISLGGAFGLLHYLDYRPTHDVDAWWVASATADEQEAVLRTIEGALQAFGKVQRRAWGDVVSIELVRDDSTVFGFQIARRSARLQPPAPTPWVEVLLDSFPDLVASKMVALVERGAPRDFRDIYTVCQTELTTPAQCWKWWQERQRLAGSDASPSRASLAVQTHLARIAQHRPLERITDATQQTQAKKVRNWFTTEFLNALLD
jgi:hypothetical protein